MKNRVFQTVCAAVATLSIAFASTAFACGPKMKKQAEPTQDAPAQQLKADANEEAEEKDDAEAVEKEQEEVAAEATPAPAAAETTVAVKEEAR